MRALDETTLQLLTWCLAFWAAVLGFAAGQRRVAYAERFVLGLALGAVLAHVGWALLHFPVVRLQPMAFLDPSVGYTVLALPLGLLALAPWRAQPRARVGFLAAAFGALPLALAVARLGCLVAGCCRGAPSSLPWAVTPAGGGTPVHPSAVYEIAGLVLLHAAARRLEPDWVMPGVLAGLGAIRVAVEPFRAAAPLGPPVVSPAALAGLWIAVGLGLSPLAAGLRSRLAGWRGSAGSGRFRPALAGRARREVAR